MQLWVIWIISHWVPLDSRTQIWKSDKNDHAWPKTQFLWAIWIGTVMDLWWSFLSPIWELSWIKSDKTRIKPEKRKISSLFDIYIISRIISRNLVSWWNNSSIIWRWIIRCLSYNVNYARLHQVTHYKRMISIHKLIHWEFIKNHKNISKYFRENEANVTKLSAIKKNTTKCSKFPIAGDIVGGNTW